VTNKHLLGPLLPNNELVESLANLLRRWEIGPQIGAPPTPFFRIAGVGGAASDFKVRIPGTNDNPAAGPDLGRVPQRGNNAVASGNPEGGAWRAARVPGACEVEKQVVEVEECEGGCFPARLGSKREHGLRLVSEIELES